MFQNKPIIGIAGGIGSGKSFIAGLFGELGCYVINSDEQVRQAYLDPEIQEVLRSWWGPDVFQLDGSVNRSAIAKRVFTDAGERSRLENLLHPWVTRARNRTMVDAAKNPQTVAFIWDTPLIFETGIQGECDAIVFVDTPDAVRYERVARTRGWEPSEIIRREKSQWGLDKKRKLAHYVVVNTADAAASRSHVREILFRILEN